MPSSQARVRTDRAGRYLTQLCRHAAQMGALGHHHGGAAPVPQHVELSETEGVIDFGWGRCTLQATGEELLLHTEADDEQRLHRVQDAITVRLERIGLRDRLTVTWRPTPPDGSAG